jgi:IS5 family transposase
MRRKINRQAELDFKPSNLKVTNEYYQQYQAVSMLLDTNPEILTLVHKDIKQSLESLNSEIPDGHCKYTSDTVLRILICMIIEGLSLRRIVVRIDDSHILRRFVRIFDGEMMDYSNLCRLKNQISPQTWYKMNQALARHAVHQDLIEGEQLRLDTTAVETNIHYPTDSGLLWDTYRVLSRLIEQARDIDPEVVGTGRLQTRKAKKLRNKIARLASKRKPASMEKLRPLYEKLIQLVIGIHEWGGQVCQNLEAVCRKGHYSEFQQSIVECIIEEIAHYGQLGIQVIDQAARRVLDDETVPNDEKLFSIFEPHTELLKRGKAGKSIEYGHMIQIQQVESKFITDYAVFENKPVEYELLNPALERHKKLFGEYPEVVAADKGYYQDMATIKALSKKIDVVSIAKKGKRTDEEVERESDPDFTFGQRFRAGVEGTISYLKRIFGLFRCCNKGWEHYRSTVGAAIFTHNILILTRI